MRGREVEKGGRRKWEMGRGRGERRMGKGKRLREGETIRKC